MPGEILPEYVIFLKSGEKVWGDWLEVSRQEVLLKREDHSYELFLFPQIAHIYRLGEKVAI